MKVLKVLDWPAKRYYGDTHPLHRWRRQLLDQELKVEIYGHGSHPALKGGDYLMIHSRYFEDGWQNTSRRTAENESALLSYLSEMKKHCGRLIWFDGADSTGCADLALLPHVDVLMKKQLLRNRKLYASTAPARALRVWLGRGGGTNESFVPCTGNQLHKLCLGWNLGLNDYRYYGYKMSRLSNFLSYQCYPLKFSGVEHEREYDLTFRGTIHQGKAGIYDISYQRNYLIGLFAELRLNIAVGKPVNKARYWRELRNAKLSVSPFGWGEICYRDFESFIAGALLVKPDMDHLDTFPNVYTAYETYIPLAWDMLDLRETIGLMISNYKEMKAIARHGQENYKKAVNDADGFIRQLKMGLDH